MSGTREGGMKAKAANLAKDPNFYQIIGGMGWDNPERSHKTGFALDPERAAAAGRKGGKKTKNEYKTQTQAINPSQSQEDSSGQG